MVGLIGWLSVALAAPADCDDWGEISPAEKVVYVGESATFRILGDDPECGDKDTCSWELSTDVGSLSATTGSPVDWTAPDSLEDCISEAFTLIATCRDGGTTSTAAVDLRCNDDQLEELRAERGSTIAGGGCGAASLAGVLLFGLGYGRRRAYQP